MTGEEALAPGTRLGELEIERGLGSGGFGITYLARDVALERRVALKEYLPREWGVRLADGTIGPRSAGVAADYRWGLERFIGEARALARLDHPQIVRVHRVMEALGTAYLVMEYVEGRSLAERLAAKGAMREAQLRPILRDLAEGLSAVHAAGLLHRDIKPANVMLRKDGSPVLIDFGAARQQIGEHSRSLTAVLTPGYAPVEQYSNAVRQGPWTDIYALGAVAYAALAGRAPNDAIERVQEDSMQPIEAVAQEPLSDGLAAAVGAALTVNSRARPQDVATWLSILGESTSTPGPSQGSPPSPLPRPRPAEPAPGEAAGAAPDLRPAAGTGSPPDSDRTGATGDRVPAGPPRPRVAARSWQVLAVGSGMVAAAALVALALGRWPMGSAGGPAATDPPGAAGASALAGSAPEDARDADAALGDDAGGPPSVLAQAGDTVAAPRVPGEVNVTPGRIELESLGATRQLSARVLDQYGEPFAAAAVSWTSADAGVATVTARGLVTAMGFGSTTLTATSGSVTGTARLAVRRLASEVAVSPGRFELESPGATRQLSASVLAGDGQRLADAEVAWTSADPRVATVTERGLVTATGSGSTTLTATSGSASGTAEIVVPEAKSWPHGHRFRDCRRCPEMIVVEGRTFPMGSPGTEAGRDANEGPRRYVTIEAPFAVGVHEVTFAEWNECARVGRCGGRIPDDEGWGQGDRPVINVSWEDARGYTEWLSERTGQQYRLPSEAEWEYVARAGTQTARYWGETPERQCLFANGYDATGSQEHTFGWEFAPCSDGKAGTAAVKSFDPNGFGLHDMLGNVWEWTQDCWNGNHSGAPLDGRAREQGVCALRMLRGGSWYNDPASLRAAKRTGVAVGYRNHNVGFRVARTIR